MHRSIFDGSDSPSAFAGATAMLNCFAISGCESLSAIRSRHLSPPAARGRMVTLAGSTAWLSMATSNYPTLTKTALVAAAGGQGTARTKRPNIIFSSAREEMNCDSTNCDREPTFWFTRVVSRRLTQESSFCDEHASEFLTAFRGNAWLDTRSAMLRNGAVCADLELTILHRGAEEQPGCIYLHEVGGNRRMATMVDWAGHSALQAQLSGCSVSAQLTHAAWAETIRLLGGRLECVQVHWRDTTTRRLGARLEVNRDDDFIIFDVRPIDAYILAVIFDAPIFIDVNTLDTLSSDSSSKLE